MVMDQCVLMAHVWGLFGTVINIDPSSSEGLRESEHPKLGVDLEVTIYVVK